MKKKKDKILKIESLDLGGSDLSYGDASNMACQYSGVYIGYREEFRLKPIESTVNEIMKSDILELESKVSILRAASKYIGEALYKLDIK